MIHISKQTRRPTGDVLDTATKLFVDELHLKPTDRTAHCASFEGGGGYVTVTTACTNPERCSVSVVSREWEYWAREFLARL